MSGYDRSTSTQIECGGANMSSVALQRMLASLGVLVIPDAVSRSGTHEIVEELRHARTQPAAVGGDHEPAYSAAGRQAELLDAPRCHHHRIATLLSDLTPTIEGFFGRVIEEMEPIGFLRYRPGGFHAPHADTAQDAVSEVRLRVISAVLFLNDGDAGPRPEFEDGSLVLYDLLSGPEWAGRGLSLEPSAGTLVVFPSTVVHEVRPVTSGERYSAVTWFH